MKTGVYAGSFDPPTNGHVWMIREAARLVDRLVVAIGLNPEKKYMFSEKERCEMLRSLCREMPNVSVMIMGNEYLADFARYCNAQYIIRGIRSGSDYEGERNLQRFNAIHAPEVQTVLLMTPRELEDVSSSFVKGLVGVRGWRHKVKDFVPPEVLTMLKKNFLERRWYGLCERLDIADPFRRKAFQELMAAYAEEKRAYHNVNHLIHCFEGLDQYRELSDSPDWIEVALWYHDIESDRAGGQPIEDAVEKAKALLREVGCPGDRAREVASLIRATAHGDSSEAAEGEKTNDERLIHDIDLGILAASGEEYAQYCRDIREEYANVPQRDFCEGRAKILKRILDNGVYLHEAPAEKWRARAVANLQQELAALFNCGGLSSPPPPPTRDSIPGP